MNSFPVHASPKVEQTGNVRIITFSGERAPGMENVIGKELEGNVADLAECHLLLDFTNVETLGITEMQTLVALHKTMKECGGRLTLFNLSVGVYETFWADQLQQRMGICRE